MKRKETLLPFPLLRNFSIVGLWTLGSRILGFLRDVLIANFLGSGPTAEAFLIAFSLPNMFRRLFAEGAFNTAFVPILSKKISCKETAELFASEALSVLLCSLLILTALAEIFMPAFVAAMASGFKDDGRFELAVDFGRVMFPYILFISLSAFFGGILNTLNRYSVTAAVPLILNITLIIGLFTANHFEKDYGLVLSCSVPLAGVLQLILTISFLQRQNFKLHFNFPKFGGDIKRLIVIAIPAFLAGGVIQINLLVGRQVASYFDGAIAWLSYADRLYQLPLGVVGIAIGIVLLPNLSKAHEGKDFEKNSVINRSAELALIFTLPATAALLIIPYPLISVLFERGAFNALDSENTSNALFVYALGLPAFIFQKIFSTIYFANENTRSPFNFALVGMLSNLILAVGLSPFFGYLAPAIGTTISGWIITFLLWKNLKAFCFHFDTQFRNTLIKILSATGLLSIFLFCADYTFSNIAFSHPQKIVALVVVILVAALLYLKICHILGLLTSFSQNLTQYTKKK